jgi:monoamine oxidase
MKKTETTVIIVGAGAAGLGAASILSKHGVDLIVLEGFIIFIYFLILIFCYYQYSYSYSYSYSYIHIYYYYYFFFFFSFYSLFLSYFIVIILFSAKNRIGGRVWNDEISKSVFIDLGANWIHNLNNENACFQLSKQLNLKLFPTSSDDEPSSKDSLLFHRGNQIDSNKFDKFAQRMATAISQLEKHYEQNKNQFEKMNIEQGLRKAINETSFNGEEEAIFRWFLERIGINLAQSPNTASLVDWLDSDSDSKVF